MDGGEPPRKNQTRVSVQVVETPKASENPPIFITANQNIEVMESDEIEYLVTLMQATDKDGDTLWYDIVGKCIKINLLLKLVWKYQRIIDIH